MCQCISTSGYGFGIYKKNVIGLPVVDELFKLDLLTFYLRGYGDGFRDVLDTLLETERPDFVVSS